MYLRMVTVVPLSTALSTSTASMKVCITQKPMPLRSAPSPVEKLFRLSGLDRVIGVEDDIRGGRL